MEGKRKTRVGRVVGNKMEKTVIVAVDTPKRHPLYKKVMRSTAKFKAHDEKQCNLGDIVRLVETRPLSKEKRWRVVEILTKGHVAEVQARDIK